jgi:hypothetical protein
MLYEYCEERGIPHKRLGKLIVATGVAETAKLDTLLRNAKENGVNDLRMMEHSQAMEMEPELRCLKALLSPTTGIIDSHSFMLSLLVYDNHIKWLLILFVFFFFQPTTSPYRVIKAFTSLFDFLSKKSLFDFQEERMAYRVELRFM